jgi:redox-sensitive bicupin YhaK (pirin superfamily)
MIRPRYQDLLPERICEMTIDDASVRLVAGEAGNKRGPVEGIVTAPHMLDITLPARGGMSHALPESHNAFAYVIDGAVLIGTQRTRVAKGQLAVLGPGTVASVRSDDGGRFLLLAARPIGEPVARYGPFVMNTQDELRQAFDDYRSGRLTQGI